MRLNGYKIGNIVHRGLHTTVCSGVREKDGMPVAVKFLNAEYPSAKDLSKIRREYRVGASLDIQGVLKHLATEKHGNGLALVTEDFGGVSVDETIKKNGKPGLREALEISLKIAGTLGQIHKNNIIHKDIKPSNIIANAETGDVKISDFGIAAKLSREKTDIVSPGRLEGTLAYISPEQTGRMNRHVDYRTDFYSLGASMYEMLTGAPPFASGDPMEIVHSHIALRPEEPCGIDPDIPKSVSNIIMKLLAKNAGDRYQSAFGIAADLEKCLGQLENSGEITVFPIAEKNVSQKFQMPWKTFRQGK